MAVILLASAFTQLGKASSPPAAQETLTPSLFHAEWPPTPASVQTDPPASALIPTPSPTLTPELTVTPTAGPAANPAVTPTPPQQPAGKTSLYFTPGTLELLIPDPPLRDYLIDSYEGFTLVVEGFASDGEGVESTEQLALERSQAVSQLLKDLGVQSYDLMSIGTYRNARNDAETADFARVDVYFLSTGSK